MNMIVGWIRKKNRERLAKRRVRKFPRPQSLCSHIDFEERVDPGLIVIRPSDNPEVSIIIPGYGKVDYTLRCLKSIESSGTRCRYEVLVVEDASGDPGAELLRQVKGIRLVWNEQNLGFLRSCNKAAALARGEFIHLLNNDTVLLEGSVDALLETARARPDAGIVGSKLVYPDGRLQEAGGLVWSNGDAANYGRNGDPREPRYCYAREADYVSGASILLSRSLWNAVGGFDDRFAPAYYEDTDLSIRLTKQGHPTLFEPRSVVVHCEGVSNGTNLESGIKAYQVVNREKFIKAHIDFLRQTKGHSGDLSYRSADSLRRRKGLVLVIDHYVPEPDIDAGSRNMLEFLRTFLALGYVVKFWPQNLQGLPKYVEPLERMGIEVMRHPYQSSFEPWIMANGKDVTHVLLSRPTVAPHYFDAVRHHTHAQVMYYGHDLHFARMKMEASVKNDADIAKAADRMMRVEMGVWDRSDLVLYPSQEEVDEVLRIAPKTPAAFVPPFQFDHFERRQTPPPERRVLFVAGFKHSPNVDAAQWLIKSIMPAVWAEVPDAEVYLVGSHPTSEVLALAERGKVHVTGCVSVDDLAAHYRDARVSVVPLRFGAGIKLKVLESMQSGVPLVTTTVGYQGLPAREGLSLPTDQAQDLAHEIICMLTSDQAWAERSERQTQWVKEHFSTDNMRRVISSLMSRSGPF